MLRPLVRRFQGEWKGNFYSPILLERKHIFCVYVFVLAKVLQSHVFCSPVRFEFDKQ